MKKYETIDEQLFAALLAQNNREQALKAVWEYFPPGNSPEALRVTRIAKSHLAFWYLQQNRFSDSYAIYRELANLEQTEREFRALGLAGEAVVLDRQEKEEDVKERLPSLLSNYKFLPSENLLKADIESLLKKYGLTAPK
jgi:hypothetical protein